MLIKDVSLLQSGAILKGRDILIEGNRISKIGRDLKDETEEETIDGHGKLAIPRSRQLSHSPCHDPLSWLR